MAGEALTQQQTYGYGVYIDSIYKYSKGSCNCGWGSCTQLNAPRVWLRVNPIHELSLELKQELFISWGINIDGLKDYVIRVFPMSKDFLDP